MPDPTTTQALTLATEHLHAGRLREAEALLRQVLAPEPDNAHALNLLSVIYAQLGRRDLAIAFAGRAVQVKPDAAAYQHHYGEAWLALGEPAQAILAFQKAIVLEPTRPEPYAGLGVALNRRGAWNASVQALGKAIDLGLRNPAIYVEMAESLMRCHRLDEAEVFLDRVAQAAPDLADAWQVRGEILGHRKQFDQALAAFTQAAELAPAYPRPHHGAGVVLALRGDLQGAAAAMERALKLDPDYPEANCGLGAILLRTGKTTEAIAYYEKAVARAPAYLEARADLALAYEKAGLVKEATAQYEVLTRASADDGTLFEFLRASLGQGKAPAAAPAGLVARLFDQYARYFDEHLTKYLGYRAPQLIFQGVARAAPALPGKLDILDLGCGTGLCGQLFKPLAATLVGVDLSPAMIQKAKERGIYDRLLVAELLEAVAAMPDRFDLITASDVFCYLGDLAPLFAKVAGVLRPGGLFAFTVEAIDSGDYTLLKTRRYAHSETYIRQLAQGLGYAQLSIERAALRSENHVEVQGLVVVFRHGAATPLSS